LAKFLLACHQFFPRFYTGTEVLTLETAQELRRRGHEVAIISTEPILPEDSAPEQVEVIQEIYDGFIVWKLKIPESIDQIQRLNRESNDNILADVFDDIIQDYNPDIVHIFHLMRLTFEFVKSVKRHNIFVYFTVTDFWLLCPTYQLIRYNDLLCAGPTPNGCTTCLIDAYTKGMPTVPLKFKLAVTWSGLASFVDETLGKCRGILANRPSRHIELFNQLDGVVWSNQFIKEMFEKNGMNNGNDHIIPFPIPKSSEQLIDIPLAKIDGPINIAFIGTLRHSKGPHVFIKAASYLSHLKDFNFFVWGAAEKESYNSELKELAKGIDNIKFCGTFPQQDFEKVLQDIHVLVVPSLWYENTPLTALSALAAKRVLIVSDLGGLTSLVKDGINGYTFKAGDSKQLAEILKNICNNKIILEKFALNIPQPNLVDRYVDNLIERVWNQ
jgi:glycosyltransferase involved in cell wall biosynthesis